MASRYEQVFNDLNEFFRGASQTASEAANAAKAKVEQLLAEREVTLIAAETRRKEAEAAAPSFSEQPSVNNSTYVTVSNPLASFTKSILKGFMIVSALQGAVRTYNEPKKFDSTGIKLTGAPNVIYVMPVAFLMNTVKAAADNTVFIRDTFKSAMRSTPIIENGGAGGNGVPPQDNGPKTGSSSEGNATTRPKIRTYNGPIAAVDINDEQRLSL
jgi:hypothetical protein